MRSPLRFIAAWIAAWCQVVVVAALPLAAPATVAQTLAQAPICQFHGQKEAPAPAQPSHGNHDCAFCVMCQTPAGVTVLPAAGPTVAPRQTVALVRFSDAQPRAPPTPPVIAAQPRGPPALS
jgi:hypothetical protein